MNTLTRRLITIPVLFITTVFLTVTLPIWLLLAWLASVLSSSARAAPRVQLFLTAYLWCETLGVLASFWLWLAYGRAASREQFIARNYALQFRWADALKRAAGRLFRLRFDIDGSDALDGPGVIMMPRHCSIGDTVIPVVFYCARHDRRLRYVLKRELLFDPCLDIVGNRLPNYFIDRGSHDTRQEVQAIAQLAVDLPADEGILIYPEGTRFTAEKRSVVIDRLAARNDPELATRAKTWDRVLPPRMAGPLGLLEANPGRDLVFCAHTGFEGSASFATLFNGSWLDTWVRIRFWRIPYSEIPRTPEALRAFLLSQWDRMNDEVAKLQDRAEAAARPLAAANS